MSHSLTLFYSPGACSLAPHVVLETLGVDFDTVRVVLAEGEHRRPEYLAINPQGRVPALRIGATVVTENSAILTWLASAHPDAALLPAVGSLAHARACEWLAWLGSSVHIAFAQVWRAERFVGSEAPPAVVASVQDHGRALIEHAFARIEAHLATREFALDEGFSVVDANLLPFHRFGWRLGLDMPGRYPGWTRHALALHQRPAVQRVLQREGLDPW